MCPLRTALSIVAGRPVSIQSPARNRPRPASRVGGRAGWPGASENVARGSRMTVRAQQPARSGARAARRAARSCASAIELVVRLRAASRRRRSTPATGATPLAEHSRLSNTHCIARPGRPTNGSSSTARSNQRLTVTIGDDGHAAGAIEHRLASAGGSPAKRSREREPRHRATRRASRCHRSPPASTPVDGIASTIDTVAGAPVRTAPPCASMNSRAGSAYIWCSGRSAARSPRPADRRPNISASTRANTGAAATIRRLIQRRQRQRIPQHLAQPRRLAVADQPVLDRLAGRRAPAASHPGRSARRACRSGVAMPQHRQPVAPVSASHSNTPASRCSGAGSARTVSRDRRPGRSIIVTASCGCRRTLIARADVAQERERLGVAAEQHVLAVVDELAGLAIGERRRAPAEPAARLEHEHARARAGQPDGGAQAGEPGADDDGVEDALTPAIAIACSAMSACRGRGTRVDAPKTRRSRSARCAAASRSTPPA